MTFPATVPYAVLGGVAIVVLSLLLVEAGLTVGWSVVTTRRDARRERTRDRVRGDLLDRTYADDPDWEPWVADLTREERIVVRDLLQTYLRRITGEDRRTLVALADALGIGEREIDRLGTRDRFDRLGALTWLALLEDPVDPDVLVETCSDHPDTRAAAARVLYEQDHPDAAAVGTDLLLDPGAPLSVLGLDTLYHLTRLDPDPLIERAADEYGQWPESLLIQVLRVLAQTGPASTDASLDWMAFLFVNDSARVRAAAAAALADYGWHSTVRRLVDLGQLRTDPSPRVRRAVYRLCGEWGDEAALDTLREAVYTETDPRAAVTAARALRESGSGGREWDFPARTAEALRWVDANERIRTAGVLE